MAETFADLFLRMCFLLFNTFKVKERVCSVKSDSVAPRTVARQALLPMGLSRQGPWSGSPLPTPGDPPNAGVEAASLASPALTRGFFAISATWKPDVKYT